MGTIGQQKAASLTIITSPRLVFPPPLSIPSVHYPTNITTTGMGKVNQTIVYSHVVLEQRERISH